MLRSIELFGNIAIDMDKFKFKKVSEELVYLIENQ